MLILLQFKIMKHFFIHLCELSVTDGPESRTPAHLTNPIDSVTDTIIHLRVGLKVITIAKNKTITDDRFWSLHSIEYY